MVSNSELAKSGKAIEIIADSVEFALEALDIWSDIRCHESHSELTAWHPLAVRRIKMADFAMTCLSMVVTGEFIADCCSCDSDSIDCDAKSDFAVFLNTLQPTLLRSQSHCINKEAWDALLRACDVVTERLNSKFGTFVSTENLGDVMRDVGRNRGLRLTMGNILPLLAKICARLSLSGRAAVDDFNQRSVVNAEQDSFLMVAMGLQSRVRALSTADTIDMSFL